MGAEILEVLGGLGLFLLGMSVMTDGLKKLGGKSLRKALSRFTKTPVSGAITGTISTALIQSSSATTVMAVGFVSAGLLSFTQAFGIILGANIGTTITGWLVALVGFKLSLKKIVLPIILLGALMRLLGTNRIKSIGTAVAGFGLVFVGISVLQEGLEGFQGIITPESFPPDTVIGRFQLLLIGLVITLVTQSSSAGVAMAITAVHVGTISLPQACAMVIGMDVGTTFTAALATIGGTINGKRTGLAHIIYNSFTGIGAFLFLPVFILGWNRLIPENVATDPEIALVAFHSTFNLLGVLAILPFTRYFTKLIIYIVPDKEKKLTSRLDQKLLEEPAAAIDNILATLADTVKQLFLTFANLLSEKKISQTSLASLNEIQDAIIETRNFLNKITIDPKDSETYSNYKTAMHLIDHTNRFLIRAQNEKLLFYSVDEPSLKVYLDLLSECLRGDAGREDGKSRTTGIEELWIELQSLVESFRSKTIEKTVTGKTPAEDTLKQLDAFRWIRRLTYHAYRVEFHLLETQATEEEYKLDEEDEEARSFD
jgi:phosphate:Na+ symporter